MKIADLEHSGPSLEARLGASDGDVDISDIGGELRRPRRFVRAGLEPPRMPPCRGIPALARELAERARDIAVDRHADVVKRRIHAAVRIAAPGVALPVLRSIPSVSREIEAAHERNRIVHDDELLVMRRAGRMPVVELEVQTPLRARGKPELGQPFALESKKKRKIPAQNVCVEMRTREAVLPLETSPPVRGS